MLADLAQRAIGLAGNQPRQISRHGADRRRDRHVVVVEHDDQPRIHRARIVHRLIGHAGGHRAVADHGDDVILLAFEIARHRHAERGGNRGRGMRCAKRVVFAFAAFGETGESAGLAQRADAVAPPGQNLVRIGLVADVPDHPVARGVEDIMQCNGELDHAQARAEMPAGDGRPRRWSPGAIRRRAAAAARRRACAGLPVSAPGREGVSPPRGFLNLHGRPHGRNMPNSRGLHPLGQGRNEPGIGGPFSLFS